MPACRLNACICLKNPPLVSVIICTHERPESLKLCLASFLTLQYPLYELILVDNAPRTGATAKVVKDFVESMPQLTYIREDRPGLSFARNAGLAAARGEIIAFTDDDVVVDREWLLELVHGFYHMDHIGCVTGLVVPAEIETYAQFLMEQYGGMGKGFRRQIFDLREHISENPLIPFSAGWFGVGANMAFRAQVLHELGGFDPATGAGTLAQGGDDLAIFFQVVTRGYRLVYEPGAVVHHFHRRSYEGFRKQVYGYGVGLTAYLTKVLLDQPALVLKILGRLPSGMVYLLSSRSNKNQTKLPDYPRELDFLERLGMLTGPLAYLRSRWQVSHLQSQDGKTPPQTSSLQVKEEHRQ